MKSLTKEDKAIIEVENDLSSKGKVKDWINEDEII